ESFQFPFTLMIVAGYVSALSLPGLTIVGFWSVTDIVLCAGPGGGLVKSGGACAVKLQVAFVPQMMSACVPSPSDIRYVDPFCPVEAFITSSNEKSWTSPLLILPSLPLSLLAWTSSMCGGETSAA